MPRRTFIWAAIISLFLDQVSKMLVYGHHETQKVIGNILRFSFTTNPRGLFGMSYGPTFLYYVLPLLGIGLVVYFAIRSRDKWLAAAYGMVLGGAVGNLIDRIRLNGAVIDFIDVGLNGWRWYTFNLADAWVVVGVLLLIGREFIPGRRHRQEDGGAETGEAAEPDSVPASGDCGQEDKPASPG